jgi:hypothetical protein
MAEEYRRVDLPVEFIAVKNAGRDLQHIRGGSAARAAALTPPLPSRRSTRPWRSVA